MNGIACTRGPPGTAGSGLSTHSYHVNILHPTLEFLELSITMTAWEKSWEIKNPRLGEIRNSHSCGPGSNLETFRQLLLEFLLCRFFLLQLQNLPQLLDTSITQSCPNLCTLGTAARQVSLSNTNSRSYSNSCPLSRWCHPTISSSVIPFSSCLQSFPALGSFPMSQFFASGGWSIGVSASASILPMYTQDWSPLGWTGWTSLQSKGLSRVFSNTTVQKHQFFGAQLSL